MLIHLQGYGLAVMVEVLCGILGGAQFGPFIRNWKTTTEVANLVSIIKTKDKSFHILLQLCKRKCKRFLRLGPIDILLMERNISVSFRNLFHSLGNE